ncbi:hypothetical protein [Mycobacteroides chelonae]|uniref:hypothetical protein n=1 Tax=Mycobacteroides chelonae TaxID=1774 RepID=UPI001041C93D|nr:hypothetical protein [Mycobacteroides chelonae]
MDEATRTMIPRLNAPTMGLIALATMAVFFAGCATAEQSPQATAKPTETTAPRPAPVSPEIRNEVVARFSGDIWPAINGFNQAPFQGNAASGRLSTMIDKDLDAPAWSRVRAGVQGLAHTGPDRAADGDLTPASVAVTAVTQADPRIATLQVCYTYTLAIVSNDPPATKREPGASEVTIELRQADAWYLHALTNDHVVPSCQSDKA